MKLSKQKYAFSLLFCFFLNISLVNAQTFLGAIEFSTANGGNYINGGTTEVLNINGSFTIEAWIYHTNTVSQISTIASKKISGGDNDGWAFFVNSSDTNDAKLIFEMKGSDGDSKSVESSADAIPLNRWVHVAATFEYSSSQDSKLSLYINGLFQQETLCGINTKLVPATASVQFNIGRFESESNFPFQGKIDEFKILNTAKTDFSDRTSQPTTTEITNDSDLTLYYNFDGSDNNVTNRKSDGINNGTIIGSVSRVSNDIYISPDVSYTLSADQKTLVSWTGTEREINMTFDPTLVAVENIGDNVFESKSISSIILPNSLKSIDAGAFANCTSLTSINIPNSVTSIGFEAFKDCSSLTSINIPNSVTSIVEAAFSGCTSLTSIDIPNSVTEIDQYAFNYCTSLTSVSIGSSVTGIVWNSFSGCNSLTDFTVDAANPNYTAQDGVLFNKTKTTLIQYPAGNTRTAYSIPNSVTSIENSTFNSCSNLTSINIPNSVTNIHDFAFSSCSNLTSVVSFKTTPPTLGPSVFSGISTSAVLKVPSSAVTSYQGTPQWQDFSSIQALPDYSSSYTLSADKKTLVSWTGTETEIDMTLDPMLAAVEKIGDNAFESKPISSIILPNSLKSIGNNAFFECNVLKSIDIPNSVTNIGINAFNSCYDLTSVSIPNSVTSIGNSAFQNCSVISFMVDSENSNYSAQDDVLFNKTQTTLIQYPIGNTRTDYSIPSSVTSIGGNAFESCEILTSITIPNSVTSIGENAFFECSGLTSITIPNSVTSIGNSAFIGCYGLTSVSIPSSVTSIGNEVFLGCSNLTEFTVDAANPNYTAQDGVLFNKTQTTLIQYPIGNTRTDYSIPNSVTSIGDYAFSSSSGLTSVVSFNTTPPTLGTDVFSGISTLAVLKVPSSATETYSNTPQWQDFNSIEAIPYTLSADQKTLQSWTGTETEIDMTLDPVLAAVENIGNGAFREKDLITSVILPEGLLTIGENAFISCTSLNSITLPSTLTSIGEYAFYQTNISSINLPELLTGIGGYAFSGSDLTSVTIPASVTTISEGLFSECASLTGIIMNEGLANIGDNSFSDCTNLTSVSIPNTVTSIGNGSFSNTKISSITIPSGVTRLQGNTFFGCTSLENVTLQAGLTKISNDEFRGCTSLTSISIPKDVTSIGQFAFLGCSGLTDFTVDAANPNYIAQDGVLFSKSKTELINYPLGNTNTSYFIPSSVTTIGEYAFSNCKLTSITITQSVTTIRGAAFSDCNSLTSLTCLVADPTTISLEPNVFSNINTSATLYVPDPTAYKSAAQWNTLTNSSSSLELTLDGSSDVCVTGTNMGTIIVNVTGGGWTL